MILLSFRLIVEKKEQSKRAKSNPLMSNTELWPTFWTSSPKSKKVVNSVNSFFLKNVGIIELAFLMSVSNM